MSVQATLGTNQSPENYYCDRDAEQYLSLNKGVIEVVHYYFLIITRYAAVDHQ
jgi:HEPN domain-containing protein